MTMVWEAARQQARDLRERFDTSDPFEICRALGIHVYETNMPDGSAGMIVKREGEDAEIFLEADDVAARRRFTCAHELGHYIERTNIAGDRDFSFRERRGAEYNLHEFFADEFAGELLMPAVEFEHLWRDRGYTTTSLAAHFRVSANAIERRRARLMKNPATA
jgi:Zn-dependent peptidase ImmA (M78 family)